MASCMPRPRSSRRSGRLATITDASPLNKADTSDYSADEIISHPFGRIQLVRHCADQPFCGVVAFVEEIVIFKESVSELRSWMAPRIAKKYFRPQSMVSTIVPPEIIEAVRSKLLKSGAAPDAGLYTAAKKVATDWLDENVMRSFKSSQGYLKFLRFRYREKQPPSLADFELMRCLGIGAFGKVNAVTKLSTGAIFALKALSKQMLLDRNMAHVVMRERNFLAQLRHPFLVNLHFAFQTDTHLYLVMDPMLGGDLAYHMGQQILFSDRKLRFYAAELVLAIGYMHSQHVIHRDIKPHNVMFDSDGHIHLTDLGLAYTCHPGERIKGQTGTKSYMAPETLFEDYSSYGSDWWALGVLLFEMLTGVHPFINADSTLESLGERVRENRLDFGEADISSELRALICDLICLDPAKRLGGTGDVQEVKTHAVFADVDWDAVEELKHQPPFVPPSGANVTGVYDFDDLMTSNAKPPASTHDMSNPFRGFDYVNVELFRKEYFNVTRDLA